MKSNVSENPGGTIYTTSLREQLAIYDRFSPEVRRLVDALPSKTDLRQVEVMVGVLGEAIAISEIVRQLELKYPGWKYHDPSAIADIRRLRREQAAKNAALRRGLGSIRTRTP